MPKIRIICPKNKQESLSKLMDVQVSYDSFVVGEANETEIENLKKQYPVEMITNLETIPLNNVNIDSSVKRISTDNKVIEHPSYDHTNSINEGKHYYIVQFIGPIKKEWLKGIDDVGGRLCDPLPNFSYIVELDKKSLEELNKMNFVKWLGHYDPKYRISPSLLINTPFKSSNDDIKVAISEMDKSSALSNKMGVINGRKDNSLGTVPYKYNISFFTEDSMNEAETSLNQMGITMVEKSEENRKITIDVSPQKDKLTDILSKIPHIHGVKLVEDIKIKKIFNNVASVIMNAKDIGEQLGLAGDGEIIGVADTGIDSGDPMMIHPDFRGRIEGITSFPINPIYDITFVRNPGGDDGAKDVDSGHGTHVSGSVLGDGSSSVSAGHEIVRGIAYRSKLYFQAIEQWMDWTDEARRYFLTQTGKNPDEMILSGIPNDISDLFGDAYNHGCRIHTNSWGGGTAGEYDQQCNDLDKFVWTHKDFTILFAAGNDGVDKNFNGQVDPGSVSSPGTAKNCITVGACENERPFGNSDRYGTWWPDDFPFGDLKNDPMSDSYEDIAAFSSRGPTNDSRIKPDVVAPGTFILSTRSRYIAANNYAWKKFPPNKDYFYMGGTSMATPLTAGAIAVLRQYLRTKKGIANPSAALLKAVLIHASKKLNYRYSGDQRNGLYDYEQGWGLVNVGPIINSNNSIGFIDNTTGLETGQRSIFEVNISSEIKPLKITLVWTDYPGPSLINNLNLLVTDPQGKRYCGNVFEAPFDSQLDTSNNVESVFIERPLVGKYIIEIIGSSVTFPKQDFALVYSGGIT